MQPYSLHNSEASMCVASHQFCVLHRSVAIVLSGNACAKKSSIIVLIKEINARIQK